MIDFHTHILPGLDDGAKSVEISSALLQTASEQGVKEIVFTPHYYGKQSVEQFLAQREKAFGEISAILPAGMRTRLGAEVHFTGVNDPSDEALCLLAIEGTKSVLFEFPFMEKWSLRLFERVEKFITNTGYTPVVAHIERYDEVLKRPALAFELAQMGCLLQMNTGAFLDKRTKGFALAMLKHGLVHCLGTDAHDTENRKPDYDEARVLVAEEGLGGNWNKAQLDMHKMLEGERVIPAFSRVKKWWKWYY